MDFGRDPYTKWCRAHDSPDAPLVRVRWFFSEQPCIEGHSVINNRVFDPNRAFEDVTVGELADWEGDFRQDYKRRFPAVKWPDHQCHPEWLATGEPWPVPEGLPPTEYGAGSIPACCDVMCEFDDCLAVTINEQPASYAIQYATPAKDATDATPCKREAVYVDFVPGGGSSPGAQWAYCPFGRLTDPVWSNTVVMTPALVPEFREDTFRIDADNWFTIREDATGLKIDAKHLGLAGNLTYKRNGTKLELCGTNSQICLDLLPPQVPIATWSLISPTGTDEATAAQIQTSDVLIFGAVAGSGIKLPVDAFGIWQTFSVNVSVAAGPIKLYAQSPNMFYGENGAGPLSELTLDIGEVVVVRQTNPGRFTILSRYNWQVPSPPAPGGTVTSVGITAPAAGITVSGSPITGAGNMTLALANDLAALEALSGTDTIYYRSGVSTWSAVTISDFLTFTGGTLKVVPPGATNGETVGSTFSITAASTTYQATGITVSLPAAGTYLITGRIRADVVPAVSSQHYIAAKLRNTTDSADVANSETFIVTSSTAGVGAGNTVPIGAVVTVAGAKTIEVYAVRVGASFSFSQISSDSAGRTALQWFRLA